MSPAYQLATVMGSQARTLFSKYVNFEYALSIWLPETYHTTKQEYPVLYVLDAPIYFGGAAFIAMFNNWDGVIPEMIVVGIGANVDSWEEWKPLRDRDLSAVEIPGRPWSGHSDDFLQFIEEELLPFVETNYRTQGDDRLIWGHSLGGTFALRALFHKPHLFNRYIVTSPSFEHSGKIIYDYRQDLALDDLASKARLFVSVGSLDNTYSARARDFMKDLAERGFNNLQLNTIILEGFDHLAASFPGFIYGLRAVYGE